MSFEDFEGEKRWRITKSNTTCRVGELITVEGSWTAEDIGNRGNDGKARPLTANPLG